MRAIVDGRSSGWQRPFQVSKLIGISLLSYPIISYQRGVK